MFGTWEFVHSHGNSLSPRILPTKPLPSHGLSNSYCFVWHRRTRWGKIRFLLGVMYHIYFFWKIIPILIATSSKLDMVNYTMAMWHRGHLGESIFRHNFCEAKMGDQVNRWLDAVSAIGDKYKDVCICFINNQRKLGSNTSELRTNRILRLEMMKGGTSSNNT